MTTRPANRCSYAERRLGFDAAGVREIKQPF